MEGLYTTRTDSPSEPKDVILPISCKRRTVTNKSECSSVRKPRLPPVKKKEK